jgi:hypothetical protein
MIYFLVHLGSEILLNTDVQNDTKTQGMLRSTVKVSKKQCIKRH